MQLRGSDPIILIDCIQSARVDDDSLNSATAILRTRLERRRQPRESHAWRARPDICSHH